MSPEEAGFRRTLRLHGRNLKLLSGDSAGIPFRGTVNRIGSIELVTDLGNDPRGDRFIEIPTDLNLAIESQAIVKDTDNNENFQIMQKEFDCPAYAVRYRAKQIDPTNDLDLQGA